MIDETRIRTETSLPEYFRRRLHRHAERLRPPPHEDTLWYLGELLHRFRRSEHFFEIHEGRLAQRPLALLYGEAQAANSQRERCLLLQRLGDLALFFGAFFPDRYARWGIRREYFIGMGSAAYDYLADSAASHRHIYRELTTGFVRMLELLAAAGSRRRDTDHQAILRLYAHWMTTGDPRAERQLRALGMPLDTPPERGH